MNYLVDTNIISEIRKGNRCHPHVARWYDGIEDKDLYLSVLVLGEIRKGIERTRLKNKAQASALENWLNAIGRAFGERILTVDRAVADEWGRLNIGRPLPVIDGLLAATAVVHHMTLVTRNTQDIAGLEVSTFNPFDTR